MPNTNHKQARDLVVSFLKDASDADVTVWLRHDGGVMQVCLGVGDCGAAACDDAISALHAVLHDVYHARQAFLAAML